MSCDHTHVHQPAPGRRYHNSLLILCNVINGSNIDIDMMQSLYGMNDAFIFSSPEQHFEENAAFSKTQK